MQFWKNKSVWLFFVLSAIIVAVNYQTGKPDFQQVSYSEFDKKRKNGEITSFVVNNSYTRANEALFGTDKEGKTQNFKVLIPSFNAFWQELLQSEAYKQGKIKVEMKPLPESSLWSAFAGSFVHILLLLGILFAFQTYQMKRLGQSDSIRMIRPEDIEEDFEDIIGIDEIKGEVLQLRSFLKEPDKYQETGAKMPKGTLLYGAPGTGKTMLAKALAKSSGVPFFYASGASFVEMFVGVGANRMRSLFDQARKHSPCIVFIDEIDSVGGKRNAWGSHSEQTGTLNELLTQMDGLLNSKGVHVIAATNMLESLDDALLRSGRFDRKLKMPVLNWEARLKLLKRLVEQKNYKMAEGFDFTSASQAMTGLSPADVTALMNEASIIQADKGKSHLDQECFNEALDKMRMGHANGHVLSDAEKKLTAYHESGHAVAALYLPEADKVSKVSIEPRGSALGVTVMLPDDDKSSYSETFLSTQISILYGGLLAERLYCKGHKSTGASNDIERISNLARKMIREWGFADSITPFLFDKESAWSENTLKSLEEQERELVSRAYGKTKTILETQKDLMENMARELMEKGTLTQDDVLRLKEQYGKNPD